MKRVMLTVILLMVVAINLKSDADACNAGDGLACSSLGVMYRNGQDYAKAMEFFIKSCDINPYSCYYAGSMYAEGLGRRQDYDKAIHFYVRSCADSDSRSGCRFLGNLLDDGNRGKIYGLKVFPFTGEGCSNGDIKECYSLGRIYELGDIAAIRVKRNYFKAKKFYTKACEGGFVKGCYRLGEMYRGGIGGKKDHLRAMNLYIKACEGGDAKGCDKLGDVYKDGKVMRLNSKSVLPKIKACEGGDTKECYALGRIYALGLGVKQDYAEAKEFFGKACDGGHNDGCKNYSILNKKEYLRD